MTDDDPARPGRVSPTRRQALRGFAAAGGLAATGAGGAAWYYRATHRRPDLLCETVVLDGTPAAPERVMLAPGESSLAVPGTRVLASSPQRTHLMDDESAWLARARPWARLGEWDGLGRSALLDIRVLTLPDGAAVAGWPSLWRYVWPRDAAFVASALARAGYPAAGVGVVDFLVRVHHLEGWFSARYLPNASGVPDTRPAQLDGVGWFCWAAEDVATTLARTDPAAAVALRNRWAPNVARAVTYVSSVLDPVTSLPPVSPDYWETAESELTLGTAAPLLMGLHHAVGFLDAAAVRDTAELARQDEQRLSRAVHRGFGPDYPRHLGGRAGDVATAWLLPPFMPPGEHTDALRTALDATVERMRRPAGGLSPGAGWKNDGISWTPQTSLVALADAASGDPARRERARERLTWLADHRTPPGSLPEKVLHDGTPAGPAPLSWTAAVVLLAIEALAA